MVIVHELKVLPKYYDFIDKGIKKFELRKNDRGFKVGDKLWLREWERGKYTERYITTEVTYILYGGKYGLAEGYCILGFK